MADNNQRIVVGEERTADLIEKSESVFARYNREHGQMQGDVGNRPLNENPFFIAEENVPAGQKIESGKLDQAEPVADQTDQFVFLPFLIPTFPLHYANKDTGFSELQTFLLHNLNMNVRFMGIPYPNLQCNFDVLVEKHLPLHYNLFFVRGIRSTLMAHLTDAVLFSSLLHCIESDDNGVTDCIFFHIRKKTCAGHRGCVQKF